MDKSHVTFLGSGFGGSGAYRVLAPRRERRSGAERGYRPLYANCRGLSSPGGLLDLKSWPCRARYRFLVMGWSLTGSAWLHFAPK